MEPHTEVAERFLYGNDELRDALGIHRGAGLEFVPLGQGEHNANFWFVHPETGRKLVLRINYASQLSLPDQVLYEHAALEALALSGRVPRPLFVDNSRSRIDHGVLVTEFREGSHLDFGKPGNVEEAARILADVHSVQPKSGCGLIRPDDPLRAQLEACRGFFAAYRGTPLEERHVVRAVERFFELTEEALATPVDEADCCHVQNTEAVPSHFLIPDDGPGSMVDWEKPVIGEVAQDVAYFLSPTTTIWDTDYVFDATARQAFVDAYWRAVDGRFPRGSFDERFPAYERSNCLLGITWSCNAWVEYHDPERPLKNAKTFELLKTYLSEDYLRQVAAICFEHAGSMSG